MKLSVADQAGWGWPIVGEQLGQLASSYSQGLRRIHLQQIRNVQALLARPTTSARARAEAIAWVRSDDEDWPFAFLMSCRVLGVDARALRRRLLLCADQVGVAKIDWQPPERPQAPALRAVG